MWLDLQPWLPLLTISLTITLCFLAGIAVGLRYKVLILVPAVTLAMIFAMIIGVARADHFWSIVLAMVVLGTAVSVRLSGWNRDTRGSRISHPAPTCASSPTARPVGSPRRHR
jgi:hypothetical protein